MKEIIVNFNDVNRRLDNFLLKYFSHLNRTLIFKLIRTNKIKVNNKRCEYNYRLQLHDNIKIYFDLEKDDLTSQNNFLKSKKPLDIIYEDNNIVIINKPIGIKSQPTSSIFSENIQDMFLKYLYSKNEYNPDKENVFIPSICNRLDTNTSGILIAAKNLITLNEVNKLLKEHNSLIKKYKCLVIGDIKPNSDILKAYHYKDENKKIVYLSKEKKPGYKEIITKYEKISFDGKYSLLDITLITGRTHQIRAHMNFIGHPLVGETKYKQKNTNIDTRFKTQALVSYYLRFNIINSSSPLFYLNNKEFIIKNIWFLNKK